jgi:hypothetical protein
VRKREAGKGRSGTLRVYKEHGETFGLMYLFSVFIVGIIS